MLTNREFSELTHMLMTGQGLNPGAAAHAQTLLAAFERDNPRMSRFLRDRIARNGLDPSDAGTELAHSLNRGRRPALGQQEPTAAPGAGSARAAFSGFPMPGLSATQAAFGAPQQSRQPIQLPILQQQPLHPIQINPGGRRER